MERLSIHVTSLFPASLSSRLVAAGLLPFQRAEVLQHRLQSFRDLSGIQLLRPLVILRKNNKSSCVKDV